MSPPYTSRIEIWRPVVRDCPTQSAPPRWLWLALILPAAICLLCAWTFATPSPLPLCRVKVASTIHNAPCVVPVEHKPAQPAPAQNPFAPRWVPVVATVTANTKDDNKRWRDGRTAYLKYIPVRGIAVPHLRRDLHLNRGRGYAVIDELRVQSIPIIPVGVPIYVPGYGMATVDDTGPEITDAWYATGTLQLDLRMTDRDAAKQWGRQTITVWVWGCP